MGLSDLVTPVTSPYRNYRQLSQYDGATYSCGDFLGALDAKPDVAVPVADDDEGLEMGPLACPGLLLNWHDFHNLILKRRTDEGVHDLVLFDGERVEIDLLQTLDLSILHKAAKLGDGDPFLLLLAASGPAAATPTVSSWAPTSTAAESASFTAPLSHN
ncbi:hypothetical protein Nepgr_020936 [Nepenthes gracilis]|uniref:Uncharacterized protein n=1 Tax=Nepenthes gracilis TaxID=150966 RepID=A0AAD3XWR3_NEPGR|nr:hypothetical protein Nepgr_020936 [Nepenthes gracilis]